MMKELLLDYEQLAKKLLEQMPGRIEAISLQVFLDEYVSFVERNRAPKTAEGVKLVRKKLLTYFSPAKKIDSIRLKDAEDFLDSVKKTAPKGLYVYLRTMKAIWNKGKEWNYIRENPFEKVKLKKRQIQKPIYVTEQQLEEILKHIKSEVVNDAVVTAFYTGCRLGEIVNLTWQDVNLKDELIMIGSSNYETKTRRQRELPIHPKVKEILTTRAPKIIKREKHNVFCKRSGYGWPFTGDYLSRSFKKACRLAGINEEIHFHSIRHGAITKMILSGAPLPAVQRIAGHSSIQTTMLYTHPDREDLRKAINKI